MGWFSPKPLTIPDVLTANAEYIGNKPAVICDDEEMSWSEFGAGISRVANAPLDSGLRKGDRVVVLMKNGAEMAEAMMGIIHGGMVAVPLNVSITDAAVAGMIANSGARAIVACNEHVPRVESIRSDIPADTQDRLISVDIEVDAWLAYNAFKQNASPNTPKVSIEPQDECNIIRRS